MNACKYASMLVRWWVIVRRRCVTRRRRSFQDSFLFTLRVVFRTAKHLYLFTFIVWKGTTAFQPYSSAWSRSPMVAAAAFCCVMRTRTLVSGSLAGWICNLFLCHRESFFVILVFKSLYFLTHVLFLLFLSLFLITSQMNLWRRTWYDENSIVLISSSFKHQKQFFDV